MILADPTVRTVAIGAGLLGAVAGAVGSVAVVRRQGLQGDAVSHAALPGVAVAFLLGAVSPVWLVVGGAVAGWIALVLVAGIVRRSKVPFDAALGGALAVFFGFGLVVITYIRKNVPSAAKHGLDRYLFGQAATLGAADLYAAAAVGLLVAACFILFWKSIELVAFDKDYAASIGVPVRRVEWFLAGLLVLAVVVGLQAVGVVLMSALVIAPAAAARQWTDRFGRMVGLSAAIGFAAAAGGTILGVALSGGGKSVPTGPTIVLTATAVVVASLLFAPGRGLVAGYLRRPDVRPA